MLQQKCGSRSGRGPRSNVKSRSLHARVCVGTWSSYACIEVETRSYIGFRFDVETRHWGPHIEEQHDYRVCHRTRSSHRVVNEVWRPHLRLECDYHIWQRTRGLRLRLKRDLHVWQGREVRFWDWNATSMFARSASEALSLVIFW